MLRGRAMWSLLLFASFLILRAAPANAGKPYVSDRILVKFEPTATSACRELAIAASGGAVVDSLPLVQYFVIQLPDTAVLTALDSIAAYPCVQIAQTVGVPSPDSSVLLLAPNDSLYSLQNDLQNTGQFGGVSGADIAAEDGWNFVHDASNVIIAVMDTGIDFYHPDLNMWTNPGEVPGNDEDDDLNGYIDDYYGYDFVDHDPVPYDNYGFGGHGTGTAGRAAAISDNTRGVAGVAWGAQVMALRVVREGQEPFRRATEDSMVMAVQYAVDHGAKILNVSLTFDSTAYGQCFQDAFRAAGDAGLVITCGAGNRGVNNDTNLPIPSTIGAAGLISVGGTNRADQFVWYTAPCPVPGEPIPFRSNYGPASVDLAAPSCSVMTMYNAGAYNFASGTSASAPMVAGAAALLLVQNPSWTNEDVKARLLGTIDTLASCVGKMVAPGRLNLGRALDNVPPTAVDLTIESTARWSQAVSWTDSGDDSTHGQAKAYVLKRWTSPITTSGAFDSATVVASGTPGPSGTYHCLEVDNLSPCTTYYWAVRLTDDAHNTSALGDPVSATTTCSGLTAAICEGGGWVQGGVGEGGDDDTFQNRTVLASHDSNQGGAVGDGVSASGWVVENRLLAIEDESMDQVEILSIRGLRGKDPLVRLLQTGRQSLVLSEATLRAVDHPVGTTAAVSPDGIVVGSTLAVAADPPGTDGSPREVPPVGFVLARGESLTIRLPVRDSTSFLMIDLEAMPTSSEALGTSTTLEVLGENGGWSAVGEIAIRPRRGRVAMPIDGALAARVIAGRPLRVHKLDMLLSASHVQADALQLVGLWNDGEDRLESFLGGQEPLSLGPSSDAVLRFAGDDSGDGLRSYFFAARTKLEDTGGEHGSTGSSRDAAHILRLGLARPNPTRGKVTIGYSLSKASTVRLVLYDVAGRVVRTLEAGVLPAGAHETVWDGLTNAGRRARPGVYFYRLEAGRFRSERKFTVISS